MSLVEAYEKWRGQAEGKACCDFALQMAITWWGDQVYKEMEILTHEKGQLTKIVKNNSSLFLLRNDKVDVCFVKCVASPTGQFYALREEFG
jgi:dihydropyrimidinase